MSHKVIISGRCIAMYFISMGPTRGLPHLRTLYSLVIDASRLLRLIGTYDTEESRGGEGGAGEHPPAGAGAAGPHLPHTGLLQIN